MSAAVDHKYALLLNHRLPGYVLKKANPFVANFTCVQPKCTDGQHSRKKRGYIYERNGKYQYHCHNCGYHNDLSYFLKEFDQQMFQDYSLESFADETTFADIKTEPKKDFPVQEKSLSGLVKISSLSSKHPAKKYVERRKIPSNQHYRLYFTPDFAKWYNKKTDSETFYAGNNIDPRLVLPLFTRDKKAFGVQGRALTSKQDQRYLTGRWDDKLPKLFGLELFNPNYKGYLFEGPIDSVCLGNNSIAMAGADVSNEDVLKTANAQKDKLIRVYDNEPRSRDIVKRMQKCIDQNIPLCVWPEYVKEKDVNDMIIAGKTSEEIKETIDKRTFTGLEAQLELNSWKKI